MPKLPIDLLTRREWQQDRDTAKIKKGAVGKVSMGDSIDKWHKARRAGELAVVEQQSAALAMDAKVYRTGLKDNDKRFAPQVETRVEKPALAFANWAKTARSELKAASTNYTNAWKTFVGDPNAKPATLVPYIKAIVKAIEDNQLNSFTSYWLEVRKALNTHSVALAANQVGLPGKPDPLSGVNKPIQDFMRRNKF